MYSSFDEISAEAKDIGPEKATVVFPHELEVLSAIVDGMNERLIEPILIGDKLKIIQTATKGNIALEKAQIIGIQDPQQASDLALDLVKKGHAAFAVKGNILTTYLYRSLIRMTKQLTPDQTPCTLCFHHVGAMDKIFVITDPGVNIRPEISVKEKILSNALWVLRSLGCDRPRVMVLASRRFKGDSSVYTQEAEHLRNIADSGLFGPCEFLPYTDLAQFVQELEIGHDTFPDLFLVPHIDAGNILVKTIDHIMGGKRQCLTVGAGMIVLTPSRSDGYEVRIQNLSLGLVVGRATSKNRKP